MAVVMLPIDADSGSPDYTAQDTRQAFSAFLGTAPSGRPLGAISGVRPGTPSTTVFLSGGGSTTWNVAAHSGVLDTQSSAAAGPYAYATDGTDTGSITAANGSNPRVDIIYVKVNDDVQDGSGLRSGQVLYLAGTAASSPVAPAVPARGMVLANINVPTSGGGAPTVSWVAPTFGVSAWTAFTPSLTNITQGNGTMTARYERVGDTVRGRIVFAAGSTTTYGSGLLGFDLPVPARYVGTAQYESCGSVWVSNGGTGSFYSGSAVLVSGSVVGMHVQTPGNVITDTLPVTWGTSARFTLDFEYEAAP